MSSILRIASFDIGKVNFAHYVEEIVPAKIKELKEEYSSLPKSLQRRVRGEMNPSIEEILRKLYLYGKRIHMGVYDLREDPTSTKLDMGTRKNLLAHLDRFRYIWDTCDIFIIEQQYFRTFPRGRRRKGTEANVDAIKIAEATCIWLMMNYSTKEICYFGSQFKTQILGAPLKLTDAQRKRWGTEKNFEIHLLRKDQEVLNLYDLQTRMKYKRMNSEEKILSFTQDFEKCSEDIKTIANKAVRYRQKFSDFSDACIQAQAFKFRTMVGCF